MKPVHIVIVAKAPQAGFAKTRLIGALGAQGAADLARRMLAQTLQTALAADLGTVELCVTPAPGAPVWRALRKTLPGRVQWSDQGSGDLGDRMARAARRVLDGGTSVLLIGTDCPQLGSAQLHRAAAALNGADAVLIPAFDGGYVLLGLARFDVSLFDGIAWSSASVATETLRRLQQLGWTVQCQPALHDIDEAHDLQWLPAGWLPKTGLPTDHVKRTRSH